MNQIVQLSQEKVAALLQWAESEGWNPGLDDAAAFYEADPHGYFAVEVDGQMVAAISVVKQDSAHAFLGLYICKPEFRGQGLGWSVWQAGMDYAEAMTVGLDGVVEQQANYAKSGFEMAWRNRRFAGVIETAEKAIRDDCQIREYQHSDLVAVLDYDKRTAGYERAVFLTGWLAGSASRKTLVAVQDSRLCGVATIRRCVSGHKVGPLLADGPGIARQLLHSVSRHVCAKEIFVDVPETNLAANVLVEGMNMQPIFETARMYRGPRPAFDNEKIFGVATLELG